LSKDQEGFLAVVQAARLHYGSARASGARLCANPVGESLQICWRPLIERLRRMITGQPLDATNIRCQTSNRGATGFLQESRARKLNQYHKKQRIGMGKQQQVRADYYCCYMER
jgi:hypothetical protein